MIRLAKIPWIQECPLIAYWGDVDAHGFAILNLLRSTGIPAEAILMDEAASQTALAMPKRRAGHEAPEAGPLSSFEDRGDGCHTPAVASSAVAS